MTCDLEIPVARMASRRKYREEKSHDGGGGSKFLFPIWHFGILKIETQREDFKLSQGLKGHYL